MPSRKDKKKATPKPAASAAPTVSLPIELTGYLDDLAARRVGGEINLRGIRFQLLYACERMLTLLRPDSQATIRLEGLEDVDLHNTLIIGQTEYVQLKTSVNELTVGNFWGLNVLQNFLAVYRGAPTATFTLAHNMSLASGLQQLARYDPAALAHWGAKLRTLDNPLTAGQAEDFLRRVRFEHVTENQLHERCIQALLAHFEVRARSEEQFLKAVFYHAFDWSRQRATVTYRQLAEVVQRVQDGYSTAPLNEAIRHNWLERVNYAAEVKRPAGAYFAGQAARPYHIAQQLPVRRAGWEVRIEAALVAHTAVAVKSSSGQGKSTLAWQVGYAWQKRGGQVYELRHCASPEAANAIVEYLRAWVRIGEQPLVVIDGLSAQTSKWAEVVERTTDLPVKFLITTREEDWYRFGSGTITLPVHLVEVALDQDEAERIYQELRQRGHLSAEVIPWQPAWEAVAERQLLIEYVYLLTQGGLLRDRLAGQLRALSQESRDAPAKLEILRLVAVADCLSLQLDTGRLVEYIAQKIGFDSDRGEVLKQLEREYFLRFGTRQVEGLHPVRSQHLAELLHELLPLEDTLTKVFGLLTPTQTQDFFTGLPGLLAAPERRELYAEIAPLLAERTFPEITAALDGLLCGEALRYWQQNHVVLDEVFATGSLELFIFETIPFAKPNLLSNLSDIGELGNSLRSLLARSSQLAPLAWADSELYLFAKLLHTHLTIDRRSATYLGISQLGDWLSRLCLALPVSSNYSEEALLGALRTKPLAETRELFAYLWLADPTAAQDFTTRHKELLFSYLQEQTDTPTLREEGNEVLIEYLLELEQANESSKLSVARLETIATFLPGYDYYHSKAVVFPCLPAHMLRVTLMNTEKRMTAETLLMPRAARINRLWADTILNLYRAKSVYEWQANLLAMRRTSVELVRQIIRLLESGMEKQTNRIKVASEAVVAQSELLEAQRQRRPKLPSTSTVELVDAEKAVAEWQASLRNFVGQLGDLITPKNSNSRNLATCNLTSAVELLPAMQDAHRTVSARHTYFELSSLEQEETKWYPRLLSSVRYFVHCQEELAGATQYAVRERISRWVDADNYTRLATLHAILRRCEQEMHVFFWLPNSFRRDGLLLTAVVGIQGIDLQDEQQMTELIYWLRDLGEISADFVLLVPVRNNQAAGQGIRYQKAFFQWVKSVADGEAIEKPSDWLLPLPIAPTPADIQTLGGVESCLTENPAEHAQIIHLFESLWKLLEYRQRLSSAASSQNWLSRLEVTTRTAVATELHHLQPKLSKENFNLLTNCATQCHANYAGIDETHLVNTLTALINSDLQERADK